MEFQYDIRQLRPTEVRLGYEDNEIAVFRKVNFFIFNLKGEIQGIEYQLKLPAPWNGFRYHLTQGKNALASAKQKREMFAFEPDRPLIRHPRLVFDLDLGGRHLRLVQGDRHALSYILYEGENACGSMALRSYEEQRKGGWQGDMIVPDDWTASMAAFIAWLTQESRDKLDQP